MNFERNMFYTQHIQRSIKQNFRPLTPAQYEVLCSKIERMPK